MGYKHLNQNDRRKVVFHLRKKIAETINAKTWHDFWVKHLGHADYRKLSSMLAIPKARKARRDIRNCSVWADFFHIIYVMRKIFKINILFVDEKNQRLYCGVDNFKESTHSIIVHWVKKGSMAHFQPVEVQDTRTGKCVTKISNRSPLMKTIHNKYETVCGRVNLKNAILMQL